MLTHPHDVLSMNLAITYHWTSEMTQCRKIVDSASFDIDPPLDGLSNLLLNSKLYVDTTEGKQVKVKSQS